MGEIGHGEYNVRVFGGLVLELIYFTLRTEHFFVLFYRERESEIEWKL